MTRTPSQDLTSGPAALWATLIGLGLATYGFYVLLLELGPEESVGPLYAACSASTAFLTLVMALDHQGYRRFIPAGTAISVSFACIVVFGLNWFDRSPAEDTQVGIFLAMGLAWFIAIPFAQAWAWGKRGADWYPALCGASWGNVQAIVLIGLFIAVAEAFLWLIGAIFDMIGLPFVLESVLQNKYAHPAIGILLAILAAQARMRLLSGGDDGWQKVTRLFAVLLVPATIAATAFIAALPFTGLAAIWSAAGGSGQLIGVAALLLLFLNAQYRDGRWMQADAPHRWALWSMGWAAALIAIFAGLAAYGVGLRIAQHGLSPARIWAGLAVGLLLIYGIGYSLGWFIASIRPGRPQFGWDRVNVGAALVVIGCLVVLSLPYSVPAALTAYHQLYRLESGAVSPRDFDAAVLDEGAIGPLSGWAEARYADWLKRHPDLAADAKRDVTSKDSLLPQSSRPLRDRIRVEPAGFTPSDALLKDLDSQGQMGDCTHESPCLMAKIDIDQDGVDDLLVVSISRRTTQAVAWRLGGDGALSTLIARFEATEAANLARDPLSLEQTQILVPGIGTILLR